MRAFLLVAVLGLAVSFSPTALACPSGCVLTPVVFQVPAILDPLVEKASELITCAVNGDLHVFVTDLNVMVSCY